MLLVEKFSKIHYGFLCKVYIFISYVKPGGQELLNGDNR